MTDLTGKLCRGLILLNGLTGLFFVLAGFRAIVSETTREVLGSFWIGSLFLLFMLVSYMFRNIAGKDVVSIGTSMIPWMMWLGVWRLLGI